MRVTYFPTVDGTRLGKGGRRLGNAGGPERVTPSGLAPPYFLFCSPTSHPPHPGSSEGRTELELSFLRAGARNTNAEGRRTNLPTARTQKDEERTFAERFFPKDERRSNSPPYRNVQRVPPRPAETAPRSHPRSESEERGRDSGGGAQKAILGVILWIITKVSEFPKIC